MYICTYVYIYLYIYSPQPGPSRVPSCRLRLSLSRVQPFYIYIIYRSLSIPKDVCVYMFTYRVRANPIFTSAPTSSRPFARAAAASDASAACRAAASASTSSRPPLSGRPRAAQSPSPGARGNRISSTEEPSIRRSGKGGGRSG